MQGVRGGGVTEIEEGTAENKGVPGSGRLTAASVATGPTRWASDEGMRRGGG